jgi:hypothetical protein
MVLVFVFVMQSFTGVLCIICYLWKKSDSFFQILVYVVYDVEKIF